MNQMALLTVDNAKLIPDSTVQSHIHPKHVTLRRLRCTWHIADSQVYIPRTSFTYDQCPLRRDLIAILIPSHWMDLKKSLIINIFLDAEFPSLFLYSSFPYECLLGRHFFTNADPDIRTSSLFVLVCKGLPEHTT
jgi:hypothetical protein